MYEMKSKTSGPEPEIDVKRSNKREKKQRRRSSLIQRNWSGRKLKMSSSRRSWRGKSKRSWPMLT